MILLNVLENLRIIIVKCKSLLPHKFSSQHPTLFNSIHNKTNQISILKISVSSAFKLKNSPIKN